MPRQTIPDRRAELDRILLDFGAHFSRRARSQWSHLPVPARRQIFAKKFEPRKLTRRQKVIGESRRSTIHHRHLDESLPARMRQQAQEAEVASPSQVAVDLGCSLLMLLKLRIVRKSGLMLNEQLLSIPGLKVYLLDEREQLLPRFPPGTTIPSRVDRRQFPPLASREAPDRLVGR